MNLTDKKYIDNLKQCMHKCFDNDEGKEILNFLALTCCGYTSVFEPSDRDITLINDGKRQVYQTIMTFLKLNSEQITELIRRKEGR